MKAIKQVCLLCFFLLLCGTLSGDVRAKIMLINSSASVEKYRVAQAEFKKSIPQSIIEVDLTEKEWKLSDVEDLLYDEYPDLIYCIGSKAYLIANKYVSEKDIVFSSIINWRRLPIAKKTYGVSNELHAGFQITLYRYFFPGVKKIGVLYSAKYNKQWFRKAQDEAKEMGIEIIGKDVVASNYTIAALKEILPGIDALWLISDPVIMSDKKNLLDVFKEADAQKVPIFSYHEAFAEYGAVLIVSVDNPTIGRQAAAIATDVLTGAKVEEKVQPPAGSHIILNLKKVKEHGLKYQEAALSSVNEIIE